MSEFWRRAPDIVAARRSRWKKIWLAYLAAFVAVAAIGVATSGPWGILGAAILFGLGAILVVIIHAANRRDMDFVIERDGDEIVIPEWKQRHRVSLLDVTDYSVDEEMRVSSAYVNGMNSTAKRLATVLSLRLRDGEERRYTISDGFMRTTTEEQESLRTTMAASLRR